MKRWAWVLLTCFFLAGVLPLYSQSAVDLVALKKKEEERRKKISKSKKVVNDSNVAMIAAGGKSYGFVQMESETPPAEGIVAGTAEAPQPTAAATEGSESEDATQPTIDATEVSESEAAPQPVAAATEGLESEDATQPTIDATEVSETKQSDFWKKQQTDLQERIAELKRSINGEQSQLNKLWADFYIKNIPAEQDAIKVQIGNLTNQIEQKKLFLSQAEAQLEELYEKARKAGIPPGWLR